MKPTGRYRTLPLVRKKWELSYAPTKARTLYSQKQMCFLQPSWEAPLFTWVFQFFRWLEDILGRLQMKPYLQWSGLHSGDLHMGRLTLEGESFGWKNSAYRMNWISWHVRIIAPIPNNLEILWGKKVHMSSVTCHLSQVTSHTCHLSLMATAKATDSPPA